MKIRDLFKIEVPIPLVVGVYITISSFVGMLYWFLEIKKDFLKMFGTFLICLLIGGSMIIAGVWRIRVRKFLYPNKKKILFATLFGPLLFHWWGGLGYTYPVNPIFPYIAITGLILWPFILLPLFIAIGVTNYTFFMFYGLCLYLTYPLSFLYCYYIYGIFEWFFHYWESKKSSISVS